MSDCNNDCSKCGKKGCSDRNDFAAPENAKSHVKKVIGVVSGKGGVGKSGVTTMLAVAAMRAGFRTAVLDADITGPSVPRAFGLTEKAHGEDDFIYPVYSKGGIGVMSMNLLLEEEGQPVVWRGPVLAGAVKQFWTDVVWGDVDYMFVDMPPGTGDVPLTVFQSLPLSGIVVVTTPQELVTVVVEKAVHMARMMKIPMLGLVENMSYLVCPHCGQKLSVFGDSRIEKTAEDFDIKNVAKLKIDPEFARAVDEGKVEDYVCPEIEEFFHKIR
ncbi:MAG: Mrp/NBP35 family ATP-binding protein [Clostridia bacterium]|nr:Mrp/NBP35 family ATP-binding protein [Clostridia bacterium]